MRVTREGSAGTDRCTDLCGDEEEGGIAIDNNRKKEEAIIYSNQDSLIV